MARGWESKDVESQQDLAEQRAAEGERPVLTAEQQQRLTKRACLQMDKLRIEGDLSRARHPRHQEQLRQALAHLEAELAAIGGDPLS